MCAQSSSLADAEREAFSICRPDENWENTCDYYDSRLCGYFDEKLEQLLKAFPELVKLRDRETGDTLLHCAIKSFYWDEARILLRAGSNLKAVNLANESCFDLLKLHIRHNPEASEPSGNWAYNLFKDRDCERFIDACSGGDLETVRDMLLKQPVLFFSNDLHATGVVGHRWNYTGLHWAAAAMDLEMMKLLLEFGVDPEARDINDCTPIEAFGDNLCATVGERMGLLNSVHKRKLHEAERLLNNGKPCFWNKAKCRFKQEGER